MRPVEMVVLLNLGLDLMEHHTLVDQAVEELTLTINTMQQLMAAKTEVPEEMDQVENSKLLEQVVEPEIPVEVAVTMKQHLGILEQEDCL